jgi:phospholipid/cholesterol/gamma-HCH transport system substrate-binding protein
VLARIRLRGDTPVLQDTRAKLALTGVTGVAIIQLSGGTPGNPPLTAPDGGVASIVADPSPLTQLLSNGEDLMTNINEVVSRASKLLSADNVEHIDHTLEHLDKATGVIADQREDIRELIKQLAVASKQANATLEQAQKLATNANTLIDGQARDTLNSARNAMASMERATASIDRILNDNRDALNGGLQGLNEIGPAVHELRDAAGSLRGITRRLDENPSGFLLGRDRSKEFVP